MNSVRTNDGCAPCTQQILRADLTLTAGAVLEEMYDTLSQMGVEVVQLHAEAGTGQFEFVTGHGPPMQVCLITPLPSSVLLRACVASMPVGCKGPGHTPTL